MNKQPFILFLTIRLGISLLVICFLWFIVAERAYYFALDDTAEHYLEQDARHALNMIGKGMETRSLDTEFRQFYRDWEEIPVNIRQEFDDVMPLENQANLVLLPERDVYLMKYQPTSASQAVFVVHQFDSEDSVDVLPIFVLNAFIAFVLLFVAIFSIINHVNRQLRKLTSMLNQIEHDTEENAGALSIREFDNIYRAIKDSFRLRAQSIRRERQFSGILSHEIRQPLAKLNAYIETLDQLDDFPLEAISILQDVKRTNGDVQNISNAILNLWNTKRLKTQNVTPHKLLTEILKSDKYKSIQFACQSEMQTSAIQANEILFLLMSRQLFDNALQYAGQSIQVILKNNQLVVSNDLSNKLHSAKEYGFGLGLVMVEQICDAMQWSWDQKISDNECVFTVNFGK